jgi:hypothetical protein
VAGSNGDIRLAGVGFVQHASGVLKDTPGVYTVSGSFTPPLDFRLHLLIRFLNHGDRLVTDADLAPIRPIDVMHDGVTYLAVTTQSELDTTQPPLFIPGSIRTLRKHEVILQDHIDFAETDDQGLKSKRSLGPRIGQHPLTTRLFSFPWLTFTPTSPAAYDAVETFTFSDATGQTVGSIKAPVLEGRIIDTAIEGVSPDMAPQIFGGFAEITGGTGSFAGLTGLVTHVGGGTTRPYQSDSLYVFALDDPDGQYCRT